MSTDGTSTTSLGNLFQCLTTLTVKDFFLISSPNLCSLSLKSLTLLLSLQTLLKSCPLLSCSSPLGIERPLSGQLAAFFRLNSPSSQSVLIGEVLHPLDHFCGPPWDALQQIHVPPVVRTPHLDTVLQVRPHHRTGEGRDHFPYPAGHASFDAAQDTVGFLGCEGISDILYSFKNKAMW